MEAPVTVRDDIISRRKRGTSERVRPERVVSGRRKDKSIIFFFLAPAILLYLALFIYPAVDAFRISLYEWTGFSFENATYVGLANFKEAITDKYLYRALRTNLWFMLGGGTGMFGLALFFAVVLTNPRYKARRFFRTVIFLPYVVNVVGVTLLWVFVLQPRFGLLNSMLKAAGLDSLAKTWLSAPYDLYSYTFILVWYVIGFYVVLLIAGIESIPKSLYDAAKIDGASDWQAFRHLTLPLLRDVLAVGATHWMILALKVFGIIWAVGRGTSVAELNTIATYMMRYALSRSGAFFRMGYGATIGVVMLILVFFLSILFFRLSRQEAIEY